MTHDFVARANCTVLYISMTELGSQRLMSGTASRKQSVELQEVEPGNDDQALTSVRDASLDVLVSNEAVGDQHDFEAPWWVDVLFIFCGVSVFARTEAFFMQTDMFVSLHAQLHTRPACVYCYVVRVRARTHTHIHMI